MVDMVDVLSSPDGQMDLGRRGARRVETRPPLINREG
jgi:hypothetical protein